MPTFLSFGSFVPIPALDEIAKEKRALRSRLDPLDGQLAVVRISETQLRDLAKKARSRLDNPNPELMAEVFDLLDIQLHRVAPDRFAGTGTIPLPHDDRPDSDLLPVGHRGEVSKEGPQPLYSNLPGLGLSFSLRIDL